MNFNTLKLVYRADELKLFKQSKFVRTYHD